MRRWHVSRSERELGRYATDAAGARKVPPPTPPPSGAAAAISRDPCAFTA